MIVLLTRPVLADNSARERDASPLRNAVSTARVRSAVAAPSTAGRSRFFPVITSACLQHVRRGHEQAQRHHPGSSIYGLLRNPQATRTSSGSDAATGIAFTYGSTCASQA